MKYFKKYSDSRITCLLCRHYCKLKDEQAGICGVNKNIDGELKTLVYGHPIALNIDPVEKKPLYHVLPGTQALSFGTVGCNFQCPFCQNWDISQERNIDKSIKIDPEQMVNLALEHNCKSIAYTYNEPTIFYPYAKDIGVIGKEKGVKNLFISNGFETPKVIRDMANWLDAANIDLKSWDSNYYKKILKGGLESVKENIQMMIEEGIWIEITTLLIEGENNSDKDIEEMAKFISEKLGQFIPWHLSAFHADYKMKDHKNTSLQTLQKAYKIAKKAGLHYVYLGNVSTDKDTLCPNCGNLLVDRRGFSLIKNRIENGHCPKCNKKIEGIWS